MTDVLAELDVLGAAAAPLFDDLCEPDALAAAERTGWHEALWSALERSGYCGVSVPEALGGAGGTVADALALLRAAGASAAPVPLAEAGLLAGTLLVPAAIPLPDGLRTVAPPSGCQGLSIEGDLVSGRATGVPWARRASWLVLPVGGAAATEVALVPGPASGLPGVAVVENTNLAGEPRDDVVLDAVAGVHGALDPGLIGGTHLEIGAASRAALMAGALTSIARMTLRYTHERHQFGRPVARFQAVQQHLVTLHQQAALANAAVDGLLVALGRGPARFEIAAAKAVASRAAVAATRSAHQAHGAIGMTQEYALHHFTRRLWAWRSEYGNERLWSSRLGGGVAGIGADLLYPAITAGSEVVSL